MPLSAWAACFFAIAATAGATGTAVDTERRLHSFTQTGALGSRTEELLRNGQRNALPVKDAAWKRINTSVFHGCERQVCQEWCKEKDLVDCGSLTLAQSCPQTADKEACSGTAVEYNGVRYVCYFTEKTYGSISATLTTSKCNIDMKSSVCKRAN
mmetsp:Transcript_17807/g.31037  ORF Transcript_17807/g.31037 Transcript_17807/m.31037 type:complete len:155 (-) Transcript_17807:57-521(-)